MAPRLPLTGERSRLRAPNFRQEQWLEMFWGVVALRPRLSTGHRSAQGYQAMLMRGEGKTIIQLAKEAGVTDSYFSRVLRLSFLAQEILKTILCNRHPLGLSAKRLANETRLPVAWEAQRALLGIG